MSWKKVTKDIKNPVTCDACREEVEGGVGNTHLPDKGMLLDFQRGGFYEGFMDNAPWDEGENRLQPWKLCHNCVTKFLHTFPALGDQLRYPALGNFVGHPCNDDTPCCDWSWTTAKDEKGRNLKDANDKWILLFPDGNGNWIRKSPEEVGRQIDTKQVKPEDTRPDARIYEFKKPIR